MKDSNRSPLQCICFGKLYCPGGNKPTVKVCSSFRVLYIPAKENKEINALIVIKLPNLVLEICFKFQSRKENLRMLPISSHTITWK